MENKNFHPNKAQHVMSSIHGRKWGGMSSKANLQICVRSGLKVHVFFYKKKVYKEMRLKLSKP